jgi:peptide/nickel transport system ATP-binding protein
MSEGTALPVRRELQVLFDDDESCLDPRRTIKDSLMDAALALELGAVEQRVRNALDPCRLDADILYATASELDAAPRRLAALARALLAEPAVVVIDEPAGHLDPSSRALVLTVLSDIARNGSTALLVLTRDVAAARSVSKTIGILERGILVEVGDAARVLTAPIHPYTQALVAAAPRLAY